MSLSLIESVVGLKDVEGSVDGFCCNVETVFGAVCCRWFVCVIVLMMVNVEPLKKQIARFASGKLVAGASIDGDCDYGRAMQLAGVMSYGRYLEEAASELLRNGEALAKYEVDA